MADTKNKALSRKKNGIEAMLAQVKPPVEALRQKRTLLERLPAQQGCCDDVSPKRVYLSTNRCEAEEPLADQEP